MPETFKAFKPKLTPNSVSNLDEMLYRGTICSLTEKDPCKTYVSFSRLNNKVRHTKKFYQALTHSFHFYALFAQKRDTGTKKTNREREKEENESRHKKTEITMLYTNVQKVKQTCTCIVYTNLEKRRETRVREKYPKDGKTTL